jgi:hypothetical protein
VNERTMPIMNGIKKNSAKQINVGRTKIGKYFFIGLFSFFMNLLLNRI